MPLVQIEVSPRYPSTRIGWSELIAARGRGERRTEFVRRSLHHRGQTCVRVEQVRGEADAPQGARELLASADVRTAQPGYATSLVCPIGGGWQSVVARGRYGTLSRRTTTRRGRQDAARSGPWRASGLRRPASTGRAARFSDHRVTRRAPALSDRDRAYRQASR